MPYSFCVLLTAGEVVGLLADGEAVGLGRQGWLAGWRCCPSVDGRVGV